MHQVTSGFFDDDHAGLRSGRKVSLLPDETLVRRDLQRISSRRGFMSTVTRSWRFHCATMSPRRSRRAMTRNRPARRQRRSMKQSPRSRRGKETGRDRRRGEDGGSHRNAKVRDPRSRSPRSARRSRKRSRPTRRRRTTRKSKTGEDRPRRLRSARRGAAAGAAALRQSHRAAGQARLHALAARRFHQGRAPLLYYDLEKREEKTITRRRGQCGTFRRRKETARLARRPMGVDQPRGESEARQDRCPPVARGDRSIPSRSGGRSSTTPGASSATSFTTRTCTSSRGKAMRERYGKLLDDALRAAT